MERENPALRIALVGFAALALAMGVGRFAYPPMLPLMEADGLLGLGAGGLLASCHFLGYLAGALSAARVPLAPRAMLRVALLLIGLATLGMGLTEDYGAWLVLRGVAGVASAWVLVLVSNYYVRALAAGGRVAAQGWVFSGVGAGTALAGLACLGFMVLGLASGPGWLALGWVSLAVGVSLGALMGDELPAGRRRPVTVDDGRTPLAWGPVLAYGVAGAGYTIPATYLPVMGREIVPSPLAFGWAWPVFGLAAFASTLLVAGLVVRFSNRRIWAAGHVVMAAGPLLPVMFRDIVAIAAAGLCVGGSFMVVTMVGMREAHRLAAPEDVIRHIAAMTTAFATGQIVGPLLASAWIAASGQLAGALALASALLVASLAGLAQRSTQSSLSPIGGEDRGEGESIDPGSRIPRDV